MQMFVNQDQYFEKKASVEATSTINHNLSYLNRQTA